MTYRVISMVIIFSAAGVICSSYLAFKIIGRERGSLKLAGAIICAILASVILTWNPLGHSMQIVPFVPAALSFIAFCVALIYWLVSSRISERGKTRIVKIVAALISGLFFWLRINYTAAGKSKNNSKT